jgi:pimeloyl-ACP methyl ester carboxylesterase
MPAASAVCLLLGQYACCVCSMLAACAVCLLRVRYACWCVVCLLHGRYACCHAPCCEEVHTRSTCAFMVALLSQPLAWRATQSYPDVIASCHAWRCAVCLLQDHLQWERAHILGFSMGGMVSQSLAVLAPHRVQSLTLLGTSRGGFQIIPNSWAGLRVAFKMVMAR